MADIDLEKEFLDNRKRKKRAKILGIVSSVTLTAFVIISYLGYAIGQRIANTTTVTLLDQSEEVGLTEIGFRVPTQIATPDQEKYGLYPDTYRVQGDGFVYWTTTSVSSSTFRFVITHSGYSPSNSVSPATSGRFLKGDPIEIKKEPEVPGIYPLVPQTKQADQKEYVGFEALFRVTRKQKDTTFTPVPAYGIYFSKDIQFYAEPELLESLRFSFESGLSSDIVSPGRIQPGITKVGGRLDLDNDGYYDTTLEGSRFSPSDPDGYKYEAAFGDFMTPLVESDWGDVVADDLPEDTTQPLSFYNAKTEAGVRPLIDYTPAEATFVPFSYYQVENPEGDPIALTDDKGIAEIKFTIWLEGWDKSAGDHLKDKTFGANLRFTASEIPA